MLRIITLPFVLALLAASALSVISVKTVPPPPALHGTPYGMPISDLALP
jgi:hypothetical protein